MNPRKPMLGGQRSLFKFFKKFRYPAEKCQLFPELFQRIITDPVYAQCIKQFFQVAQFPVPSFLATAVIAFLPK